MNKKKVYTYILPACAAILLIAISWWGYTRLSFQEEQADIDLYTLVPANSEAILETNDINALYKTIRNSHYIQQYDFLQVSDLLDLLTNNIENLSRQQAHGLSTEMNRQLLVSFHQPGTSHDQIIYGRFGHGDMNTINRMVQKSTGSNHTPKKMKYKGEDIIIYPIGKDFLACYIKPGFFAISFQEKLIEQVIDTQQEGTAVSNDTSFKSLRKQTKHNEQLSLYLCPNPKSPSWQHYEIRMNAMAIYITNNQTATDTISEQTGQTPLFERMDGIHLPQRTQLMAQIPFRKSESKDSLFHSASTMEKILADNECQEIDLILFSQPTPSDTLYRQLLMATIPTGQMDKVKSQLRFVPNAKRRTSIWLQNTPYPIWQCPADTTLNHYFVSGNKTGEHWLSIYQNYLLLATDKETIHHYLTEMQTDEDERASAPYACNNIAYQHCLGDLAEEANFTLVADLNDIINHYPNIAKDNPLINPFLFKHKDFFKNFMLSTQFIQADGHSSLQVILTYQGDSILFKQARD